MGRRTPLHDLHQSLGARMVDFGGWDMPVHYGSQIDEHHAVRRRAGVFDVSHMCVIDLKGDKARAFLQELIANDVGKLKTPGKALYSCMLNEAGGVLDDLIVYFLDDAWFRMVVNAGTRDKDLAWIRQHASRFAVQVIERADLAMLAIQGPQARELTAGLMPAAMAQAALALEPFFGAECGSGALGPRHGAWFVARTGYTGEDGFEVMLPADQAPQLWRSLNDCGVASCGLGARDTLRLEAGMNLYGNDMDEQTNPLESGLAWTVAFEPVERSFIGREALESLKQAGLTRKLVGLVLEDRGVLRSHQKVIVPELEASAGTESRANAAGQSSSASEAPAVGEITSGTFSPTLQKSIGLARVPRATQNHVQVEIRGKLLDARVVKPPFVRHGTSLVN